MYIKDGVRYRDIPLGPSWDEIEANRMRREDETVVRRLKRFEYEPDWRHN